MKTACIESAGKVIVGKNLIEGRFIALLQYSLIGGNPVDAEVATNTRDTNNPVSPKSQ
ncbi:hypothetical protein NBRC116493_20010 [Aurantivibrio infirmus]